MENTFSLPTIISSKSDLGRVIRELEAINEYLQQKVLRHSGTTVELPRTSRALQELAAINNISLLDQGKRTVCLQFLKEYKERCKVLHISFAAEPSPAFVHKITAWLRENIDPLVLLQIGLQPDIAAGCTVRSKNKYFDFSLRRELAKHRPELVGLIRGRIQEQVQVAPAQNEPQEARK